MSGSEHNEAPPTEPTPMRWQFIDASDNSRRNLTQVKRHVMHEYMRQKRHDGTQQRSDGEEASQEPPASQPKRRRPRRTRNWKNTTTENGKKRQGGGQKKGAAPPSDSTRDATRNDIVEEVEQGSTTTDTGEDRTKVSSFSLPHRTSPVPAGHFLTPPSIFNQYAWSGGYSDSSDLGSLTPSLSSTPTSPSQIPLSPRSFLSAARTDPFNSFPMELDMEGQKLFDFYVKEMPACSYGTQFRSPKAHNWYTMVFVPEGMKGAVAFQNTILVHAANTWAWVRNETETEYSLAHRDRAITMQRDHMVKNPNDISDVAIIACLSAAGLEDFDPRPGRKQISWVHMRAAREMIRARGGPAAFENTRLGMLINWQDFILSGYEANGPSFFFEHDPLLPIPLSEQMPSPTQVPVPFQSTPSPPHSTPSLSFKSSPCPPTEPALFTTGHQLSPEEEIQHQCGEFINFLRRCEELALCQKNNPGASGPTRHGAFEETALLYQILAAPPGARFTASGDRKQFVARLVALMMLNAGLWDYRHAVPRSEAYLAALEQDIIDSEVNTNGSIEALLQIMLACKDGSFESIGDGFEYLSAGLPPSQLDIEDFPDFTQYSPTAETPYGRPWFAGRMLKVAKRLSLESWLKVNDILFSCLTLQIERPTMPLWENELRQEVLSAPLTSYVMPSLYGWAA